jgi:alkylation response protein AidB-like acyl-CoA dehydrogenase
MTSIFRIGDRQHSLLEEVLRVAQAAAERAASLDENGVFPTDDVEALARIGLLMAPFPPEFGGIGIGTTPQGQGTLFNILRVLGAGSLVVGRLYEGHVNAVALICHYGTLAQKERFAAEVSGGQMSAVWNAEPSNAPLRLVDRGGVRRLEGTKSFASGAGFIARPLVTARTQDDRLFMVMLRLNGDQYVDRQSWRARGMRASATATINLSNVVIADSDIVGDADDYLKEPMFSTGAWRFTAVQLGGIERILDELRQDLRRTGRGIDAYQLARLGQAGMAAESARLWVERASALIGTDAFQADRAIAYVLLARSVVERAGVQMLELAERSVGLSGFLKPHPLEIVLRDLSVYLRQPGPDRILADAARFVLDTQEATFDLWR